MQTLIKDRVGPLALAREIGGALVMVKQDAVAPSSVAGVISVDNDTTLASDSTTNAASVHAVRGYVATAVTGLLEFKGSTDCSANPNYPAASKGDAYLVSVAGKIGGASGTSVDVGDAYVASADNAGGTQASVGTSWFSLEHNAVAGSFTAASTTEVLTGTDTTKGVTPDALAALWEQGSNIASAGTISVGEGGYFHVTGTTTITDIDPATDKAGRAFVLVFDGVLTLTHHATTLILPTGANITTAAGDVARFRSEGSDAVKCVGYQRASGAALVGGGASTTQTTEQISGFIASPSDKSYTIALKMAHAGTVTEATTKSASGTCTATFKVNSTALGGTANSVSSSEQSQAHSGTNTFVAGDDIVLTVSSNSSCADMSFTIKYTRVLE